eukprot:364750-Chlamydomonas_euryale.AAC.10
MHCDCVAAMRCGALSGVGAIANLRPLSQTLRPGGGSRGRRGAKKRPICVTVGDQSVSRALLHSGRYSERSCATRYHPCPASRKVSIGLFAQADHLSSKCLTVECCNLQELTPGDNQYW